MNAVALLVHIVIIVIIGAVLVFADRALVKDPALQQVIYYVILAICAIAIIVRLMPFIGGPVVWPVD